MENMENPARLAGRHGAEKPIHATAEGIRNVARRKAKRHNSCTAYLVTPTQGDPFRIVVSGRDRWTLEELRKAGAKGCTPIDNPAPRWSAYIHNLRRLGVHIETLHEPHGGEFSGTHARYVLRTTVTPMTEDGNPDGKTV